MECSEKLEYLLKLEAIKIKLIIKYKRKKICLSCGKSLRKKKQII